MDEHRTLLKKDLYYAAFWCCWRPDDFPQPEQHLTVTFPNRTEEEIKNALQLAKRLRGELGSVPDPQGSPGMSFSAVASYLKKRVPGLSRAAYDTAADKVFFINR